MIMLVIIDVFKNLRFGQRLIKLYSLHLKGQHRDITPSNVKYTTSLTSISILSTVLSSIKFYSLREMLYATRNRTNCEHKFSACDFDFWFWQIHAPLIQIIHRHYFCFSGMLNYPEPYGKLNLGGFMCSQCGRRYRYRRGLWAHLKLECGKEPQFACTICNKRYTHKCSLKAHCLRHGVIL